MKIRICGWLPLAAMVIIAPGAAARGQAFGELVSRLPPGANSLVLLNADKILSSPVAIRQNWRARHEQAYAAGLSLLPPDAKQAVFATAMNLEQMTPEWEAVVMRLDAAPDMANLARSSGGSLQFIDDLKAVAIPSNAYAVQFSANIVGAMTPVDRHSVGRWIRETNAVTKPDLTPYLAEAFSYANNLGTPIILAIDLQDIATPEQVLAMLKASDKFTNEPDAVLQRMAKTLAGIHGLTLGITLGEEPFGKVKVDFSDDLNISPALAKAMLLHALAKRGAMLKELDGWTPNVSGKQVTLEGNLTSSGLKRIFSLFDRPPSFRAPSASPPPSLATSPPTTSPTSPPPPLPPSAAIASGPSDERAKVYSAKAYFNRVADYVNDLRSSTYSASTMGAAALWYDSYARKIDQLPIAGVDPDLVAYARRTADSMRQASSQIKSANYNKAVRQANVQPQYVTNTWGVVYGYSYGWYGNGGPVGASGTYTTRDIGAENSEKSAIRSQETAQAGMSSSQIMQRIEQDTASTRQRMSAKYKENF